MIKTIVGPWAVYANENGSPINKDKCGKWMYYSSDIEKMIELCTKAIKEGIVDEYKHSYELSMQYKEYMACFYIDGTDKMAHRRVIQFFLDNGMIRKTNTGRYYDIGFKFDNQTREGLYGKDFEAVIKLHDFVDLNTGKML